MNHYGSYSQPLYHCGFFFFFFFCGPHKEIIMLYDNYMFSYGRSSTNHLAPVLKCAVIKGNNTSYQTPLTPTCFRGVSLGGHSFMQQAQVSSWCLEPFKCQKVSVIGDPLAYGAGQGVNFNPQGEWTH